MSNKGEKNKKESLIEKSLQELFSLEEERMEIALEELKEHSNEKVLPAFESIYSKSTKKIQHLIIDFISSITDDKSAKAIMEIIQNTSNEEVRTAFLSTIWSSRIDFSEYLNVFVDLSIDGSLMDAFECYTIITNMDGHFDEDELLNAKMTLKSNFETFAKDEQRLTLLTEILQKLNDFDQEI